MKTGCNIILCVFVLFLTFFCFSGELFAYSVTYDQVIKPPFGSEIIARVWFKDNLLRIETNVSGQEMITIGNDSGAYNYLPTQNMATKVKRETLSKDLIRYPEKYLDYIRLLGARKTGSDAIEGEVCDIYEYSEKNSGSDIKAYVSVKKKLPLKLILENEFGRSIVTFNNIVIGENLPDALFQLPKGVHIIETDDL